MAFNPCTAASYISLWEQLLPESYRESIATNGEQGEGVENPAADIGKAGAGYDLPSLQAAIFARFEQAANTSQQAYFCRPHSVATGPTAASPARASGVLEITREGQLGTRLTLPAGLELEASRLDSLGETEIVGYYRLAEAVAFAPGVGSLSVQVEALSVGYDYNIPADGMTSWRFRPIGRLPEVTGTVTALVAPDSYAEITVTGGIPWGTARPALLRTRAAGVGPVYLPEPDGSVLSPVEVDFLPVGQEVIIEPDDWNDLGLKIAQNQDITGGLSDAIAAIGAERGIERLSGESDLGYCQRITTLPDIVTPAAVRRLASRVLDPLSIEWEFVEPSPRRFEIRVTERQIGVFGMACDETDFGLSALDNVDNSIGFLDVGNFVFEEALGRLRSELEQIRAAGVAGVVVTV